MLECGIFIENVRNMGRGTWHCTPEDHECCRISYIVIGPVYINLHILNANFLAQMISEIDGELTTESLLP